MRIPTTALMSVVLVLTTLSAISRPTFDVNVLNFPLDEEGNLKTATVRSSRIMLVFNETVTVPSSVSTFTYLASFNANSFRDVSIMAKAEGSWQTGANIHIYVYEHNFGILTIPAGFGHMSLKTGSETYHPDYGTGSVSGYPIQAESIDLYLQVYNSNVGFDGLLTIVAYLTN